MTSVLITGSDGHLGKCLVRAFDNRGYEVTGSDLPGTGADIECNLDIGEWTDMPMGHYDIVICNAKTRTWEIHHELATRARKAIVTVASIYGVLGPDPEMYKNTEIPMTPAYYAAAKGAMIALTKYQATTLAPVRSNAVILGGIERGHSDEFKRRYTSKVPLKRMATEADAVNAIMFLASDAASYITGTTLVVDGGLTART